MTEQRSEPISTLYSRRILQLAGSIGRIGRLEAPDASADAVSRLCGSRITVDLKLAEGRVSDYAQEVQACALGQTAASVMAREIMGSAPDELRELRERMWNMLKNEGTPPGGKWADLALLEGVRDYPARHGSVMLPFDAVVKALDRVEAAART
ncbi:MAG: iron-sulfur cluster assembly scaffold protein [Alphaproteobacteria bacterium]